MITEFAIELVRGILTKTQTLTYNNGRTVKRIYPTIDAQVPNDVVEVGNSPLPQDGIHNMEYELYARHARV
jgi:hypothetical protein